MQKSNYTKIKLFVAFFVSITATGSQAAQPNINHNVDSQQLTALLKSMDQEDQKQFLKLLEEASSISNKNKKFNTDRFLNDVKTFIEKIPYTKVSALLARLVIAVLCWDFIHPWLKNAFPTWETATELPKAVSGALIIDGIKDFFKEVREVTESKIYTTVMGEIEIEVEEVVGIA